MTVKHTGPFTLARTIVSHKDFVSSWAPVYEYKLELLYDRNIGKELNPTRIEVLFLWKNGGTIAARKLASVRRNFVDRRGELDDLDEATSAEDFLRHFRNGGAIWRIFWLHLWKPDLYPIFDQHVYRAMTWIRSGVPGEIPVADPKKIRSYLDDYLPFHAEFTGLDQRLVDKALWACGKCMKPLAAAPVG